MLKFDEPEKKEIMKHQIDEHYLNPRLVDIYDFENPWAEDTDYYLSLATKNKMNILDLGCGTGILACAFSAKGHYVTGVDPSEQMLEQAKKKQGANKVKWVCSRAEDFCSNQRFDLIIMTGHVFQIFITDEEIQNILKTMRLHLSKEGIISFEVLNPSVKLWKNWTSDTCKIFTKDKETIKCWKEIISIEDTKVTFYNIYQFPDTVLKSQSTLGFRSHKDLKAKIEKEGFNISQAYGDWFQTPFTENSKEIIFVLKSKGYNSSDLKT